MQAARSGELGKLEQVLQSLSPHDIKACINEHDKKNYSALHYAALSDNLPMVKLLLAYEAGLVR